MLKVRGMIMRRFWEVLKFAGLWIGPLLILLALYLYLFPLGPFMSGLGFVVAVPGAVVTTVAWTFARAPRRRTGRKILAVVTLAGIAVAGWQFVETKRGYAYHQEAISFENRGARLKGAMYLPDRQGRVPGIVLVHGSGDLPRNSQTGMARQLVRRGYAVILYDKRGTGESTGHFEAVQALSPDNIDLLASDASAAHDVLAARREVRPDMVGFFGSSQAGWIIPRAAVLNGHAAFMLLLSGPVVSTHHWLQYERFHLGPPNGPATLGKILKAFSRGDIPKGMTPDQAWKASQAQPLVLPYGDYDPVTDLRALDIPALWLLGDRDWMVPSGSTARNLDTLRALGKPFEYRHIPSAGHSMLPSPGRLVEHSLEQWLARATSR